VYLQVQIACKIPMSVLAVGPLERYKPVRPRSADFSIFWGHESSSTNILLSSNIRILSYPLLMSTKKITVLMAAVIAVAMVLAAGLAVLYSIEPYRT
jgi:hypothetical protein